MSNPTACGSVCTIRLDPHPMSRMPVAPSTIPRMTRNRARCQYRCKGIHESNARWS